MFLNYSLWKLKKEHAGCILYSAFPFWLVLCTEELKLGFLSVNVLRAFGASLRYEFSSHDLHSELSTAHGQQTNSSPLIFR